jgi:hypothetical protein
MDPADPQVEQLVQYIQSTVASKRDLNALREDLKLAKRQYAFFITMQLWPSCLCVSQLFFTMNCANVLLLRVLGDAQNKFNHHAPPQRERDFHHPNMYRLEAERQRCGLLRAKLRNVLQLNVVSYHSSDPNTTQANFLLIALILAAFHHVPAQIPTGTRYAPMISCAAQDALCHCFALLHGTMGPTLCKEVHIHMRANDEQSLQNDLLHPLSHQLSMPRESKLLVCYLTRMQMLEAQQQLP